MTSTNKEIERACDSLERSIKKLIQDHNKFPPGCKKLEEDCMHYVRHANHVLRTLVAKRTSLEYAVSAFEESSNNYIEAFKKLNKSQGDKQREILTKWFTHFLRLRGELLQL
jgi:hypothetical protein